MAKNLVIVESPAKAKTIEQYLGSEYKVKSSFGHIRDLPKKGLNIDIAKNFEPTYAISEDKQKVVNDLKKAAKGHTVWLASDEDREGEAIAWHLTYALGLDPKTTKRIVFHEITKPAIEHAIKSPRTVDKKLVDAQQARRVLDRLVGYELSPVLWKKVRTGLSAGRVQSVAVRLIVEREREIKAFQTASDYKVTALFDSKGKELKAELPERLKDQAKAEAWLTQAKAASFTVKDVSAKPGSRNPGAPFTTSSLQQTAANKLGFSVKQTMVLAQKLYEHGNITYMRTDSTNLSNTALEAAAKYIKKEYGDEYYQKRQFKTKSAGAQEAHEAIRPTHFNNTSAGHDAQEKKLYDLIWRRTLASQMTPAKVERTEVIIEQSNAKATYLAKGETLKFQGFLKVYGKIKDDTILPAVEPGQKLPLKQMDAVQTYAKPPARYSEAALVKKLEELGIGRPSTYAPTISTIQTRGYIEKSDLEGVERKATTVSLAKGKLTTTEKTEVTGADRAKLLPTPIADMTTDFLTKHFASIVDYDFTAKAEKGFDDVAEGKEKWQQMIADFYKHFHPLIEKSDKVSREETSQARKLGKDPKTGRPIVVRYGRYGPMLQMGEAEDDEKPRFAAMPEGVSMEEVTLAQALEMFKLPRVVGKTSDGQEITADIGRFGPYIKVDQTFVSIKDKDPLKITETEARKAYNAKLKKEAERHIQTFEKSGLQILNGMYGPYVTDGKKNAKVPKAQDPKKLTEAQALKILKEAPDKKRFPRRKNPTAG